jgi:hypothetical protein
MMSAGGVGRASRFASDNALTETRISRFARQAAEIWRIVQVAEALKPPFTEVNLRQTAAAV